MPPFEPPPPCAAEPRILYLAYTFPPLGGAGVQRSLKMVRYLPEYGWIPIVVTTTSTAYPARDSSLLAEIPPCVRVIRAFEPELWRRTRRLVSRALAHLHVPGAVPWVNWPDDASGWAPFAFAAALRQIRRHAPLVIVSTSAPYTAHLVGAALHVCTGIPWVADFRDEWSYNPFSRHLHSALKTVNARTERLIVQRASRVVVVADWFRFAGRPAHPAIEIPNGVDEEDLVNSAQAKLSPRDRFRLTYVGTLYAEQDLKPVLDALQRLIASGRMDAATVEVRLVGNIWLGRNFESTDVPVVIVGYVNHQLAVAEMMSASALLLYVAPSSRAPSGKLYEYLASDQPILCIARRDNLAYHLVDELGGGPCATPDDPKAIEHAILDLYRRWRAGSLDHYTGGREEAVARYSRKALASHLATVLDDVTGRGTTWSRASTD